MAFKAFMKMCKDLSNEPKFTQIGQGIRGWLQAILRMSEFRSS